MTTPVGSTSNNVFSTAGATSATPTAAAAATAGASFGEQDFLKLLMAQMSNQDPLQPTDSTQFVTQLATFSQVEQSVQQSTQLSNIASQLASLNNADATALMGKNVTVQNTSMQWNGSTATSAAVSLTGAAQSVSVAVQDAQGNTVRTMAMGPHAAGTLPITWDGREDSGQAAPVGTYSIQVTATGANNQNVGVSQTISGVVSQVSYSGGVPSVTLANGATAPASQIISVSGASTSTGAATTQTTP